MSVFAILNPLMHLQNSYVKVPSQIDVHTTYTGYKNCNKEKRFFKIKNVEKCIRPNHTYQILIVFVCLFSPLNCQVHNFILLLKNKQQQQKTQLLIYFQHTFKNHQEANPSKPRASD